MLLRAEMDIALAAAPALLLDLAEIPGEGQLFFIRKVLRRINEDAEAVHGIGEEKAYLAQHVPNYSISV